MTRFRWHDQPQHTGQRPHARGPFLGRRDDDDKGRRHHARDMLHIATIHAGSPDIDWTRTSEGLELSQEGEPVARFYDPDLEVETFDGGIHLHRPLRQDGRGRDNRTRDALDYSRGKADHIGALHALNLTNRRFWNER
jgi:hypothetical protein